MYLLVLCDLYKVNIIKSTAESINSKLKEGNFLSMLIRHLHNIYNRDNNINITYKVPVLHWIAARKHVKQRIAIVMYFPVQDIHNLSGNYNWLNTDNTY